MKSITKTKMFQYLTANIAVLATLCSCPTFAGEGHGGGNGGDPVERRFREITADITSWINAGGSKGLVLPENITRDSYNETMLKYLDTNNTTVVATLDKVYVESVEKVCKNFFEKDNSAKIICNSERFSRSSEEEQYKLVHHEIAGLAGFEVNGDASSKYFLSNQITSYLVPTTVMKLAVKQGSSYDISNYTEIPNDKLDLNGNKLAKKLEKALGIPVVLDALKSERCTNYQMSLWLTEVDEMSDRSKSGFLSSLKKYTEFVIPAIETVQTLHGNSVFLRYLEQYTVHIRGGGNFIHYRVKEYKDLNNDWFLIGSNPVNKFIEDSSKIIYHSENAKSMATVQFSNTTIEAAYHYSNATNRDPGISVPTEKEFADMPVCGKMISLREIMKH